MHAVQILHHVELEPKEHVLTLSVLKLGDNYSQVRTPSFYVCVCVRWCVVCRVPCVSCAVEAHRSSQVNRELRPYVVVGTSYAEGEDAAGRGRISFPTPFLFFDSNYMFIYFYFYVFV
jgi:hypothetical protein